MIIQLRPRTRTLSHTHTTLTERASEQREKERQRERQGKNVWRKEKRQKRKRERAEGESPMYFCSSFASVHEKLVVQHYKSYFTAHTLSLQAHQLVSWNVCMHCRQVQNEQSIAE